MAQGSSTRPSLPPISLDEVVSVESTPVQTSALPPISFDEVTSIADAPPPAPAKPPAPVTSPAPESGGFMQSVGRGVDIAQGLGYSAAEWLGEATGSDAVTRFGREGRERNQAEVQAAGPGRSIANVDSPGAFFQWAVDAFGEQIPMMGPSVVGGITGAAAGSVVPGIGTTLGGLIGAAFPSLVMGVGEVQMGAKERDPNAVVTGEALLGGSAIAAFDTVFPGKIGGALVRKFGRETAEQIARRVLEKPAAGLVRRAASGAVTGFSTEGLTEALQEAIGEVAVAKGTNTPISPDLPMQMVEAGATGALMGGAMGVAEGAVPQRGPAPPAAAAKPPIDLSEVESIEPAGDVQIQPEAQPAPPAEAPTPEAAPTSPGVPSLITRQMVADLRARGISEPEIGRMTPQQAWEVLQTPQAPAPVAPESETIPAQPETTPLVPETIPAQAETIPPVDETVAAPEAPQPVATPPAQKPVEEMSDEELFAALEAEVQGEQAAAPVTQPVAEPEPAAAKTPKYAELSADERSQVRRILRELQEFKFDQPGRQDIPWWEMGANEAQVSPRLPNASIYQNLNTESRRSGKSLIKSIEAYMAGSRPTSIHRDVVAAARGRMTGDVEVRGGWTLPPDAGDAGVIRARPIRTGKPDEAKERETILALEQRDKVELLDEYTSRFGNVLNADNMSELLGVHEGDARWAHHDAVRSSAGAAVQAAYERALAEPVTEANDVVRFSGGGTGSGKSSVFASLKPGYLGLDTTLGNLEATIDNIDMALQTGRNVEVDFVYRDPIDAFFRGVVPRFHETGRPVSVLSHAHSHFHAPRVAAAIQDRYALDPRVSVKILDNSDPATPIRDVEWLAEQAGRYNSRDELRSALDAAIAAAVSTGALEPAVARRLGATEAVAAGEPRPGPARPAEAPPEAPEAREVAPTDGPKVTFNDQGRPLRANGLLEPLVGDKVYQTVRGFGGTAAYIHGEVYQAKGGNLRVRITGSAALLGSGPAAGKTYAMGPEWIVENDPEVARRTKAREDAEAARQQEMADEEAAAKATRAATRADIEQAGGHPLTRETPVGTRVRVLMSEAPDYATVVGHTDAGDPLVLHDEDVREGSTTERTIGKPGEDGTWGEWYVVDPSAPAAPPPPQLAFTADKLEYAFDLTPEQAEAAVAIAEAMDLDTSKITLVKGGTPGEGAMPQDDILPTGERQPRLPGAEDVRDQEVEQPTLGEVREDFGLDGGHDERPVVQETLFGAPVKPSKAKAAKPRDPNQNVLFQRGDRFTLTAVARPESEDPRYAEAKRLYRERGAGQSPARMARALADTGVKLPARTAAEKRAANELVARLIREAEAPAVLYQRSEKIDALKPANERGGVTVPFATDLTTFIRVPTKQDVEAFGQEEAVAIADLVATQDSLDPDHAQRLFEGVWPRAGHPIGVRRGGKVYLVDGHHRAAADWATGAETITVTVVPEAKINTKPTRLSSPTAALSSLFKADELRQGEKAAVEFAAGGIALIRSMASPDVSSAVHELAHVARRFLFDVMIPSDQRQGISDEDIHTAAEWAGATLERNVWVWSREAEEKFARGFERYLRDGQAPSSRLSALFGKFADWLGSIYRLVAGSSIDIDISPEMRGVYDKLVTRRLNRERREAAATGPKIDMIESRGAAADRYKAGDEVVYKGRRYTVRGRTAIDYLTINTNEGGFDARDVDPRQLTSYEESLVSRGADAKPETTSVTKGGVTLRVNDRGNLEVKFSTKPDRSVIDAVKSHGMRWSGKDKVWYGKNTASKRAGLQRTLGIDLNAEPAKADEPKVKFTKAAIIPTRGGVVAVPLDETTEEPTAIAGQLGLRIGNEVREVASFEEAGRLHDEMVDRAEREGIGGASNMPSADIIDLSSKQVVAHISYNGRIWEGRRQDWTNATKEIARTDDRGYGKQAAIDVEPTREFASTQINLPPALADRVRAVASRIADEDLATHGREATPHVTIQYGLHSDDPAPVRHALQALDGAAPLTLDRYGYFEGDEADVVYMGVGLSGKARLMPLRNAVRGAGDVTDTFPDYRPHITIAYVKPGLGRKYADNLNATDDTLQGQGFDVTEVVFSPADGEPTVITLGETKAPSKREAIQQAKTEVDAEIDDLIGQIAKKLNTEATSGVDPELGVLMVKLVRAYIKKGVLEFREVALNVQEKLGPKARTLDRHLELAWKKLRGEDVKVTDALTGGRIVEEEQADGRSDARDGRGTDAGAGQRDEPAGGLGEDRPVDVAGEQPGAEEGAPDAPAAGGKRRPARRPRGGRRGDSAPSDGRQPGGRAGADAAGHADTADTVDDPDVADANARGEQPRHFVISDEAILTQGGWAAKLDDNLAALELLKQLDREQRPASDDEQRVLARYIGWGHTNLAPVVGPLDARAAKRDPKVVQARQRLEEILTPKELQSLGDSVINAHYSFNELPQAMWSLVQRLGFKGGSVLEPAIGTGHFFGTMPGAIVQHKNTRLFGVDMEPIASGIAKQLYQGASIQTSPLEEAIVPQDYFDLVISNVPFGNVEVFDPAFVSSGRRVMTRSLHNYYFGKALDVVRPGGLVVFITSRYTMDSQSDAVRKYLAQRAEFLGAIRLTDEAFSSTAGTRVVTDVIVLRRREEGETPKKSELAWTESVERESLKRWHRGEDVTPHTNEYYVSHPEMVLGTESLAGKMAQTAAPQYTVEGPTTAEALAGAVARFPQGLYKPSKKAPRKVAVGQNVDTKQGSFVWQDGKLFTYDKGTLQPSDLTGKDLERAKTFIPLRDAYQAVLDVLVGRGADADLTVAQKTLTAAYDRFVHAFGPVSEPRNRRVIENDPNGPRILALEDLSRVKRGNKYEYRVSRLSDIFAKRVAAPIEEPTSAASAKDALVQSLAWKGGVDLDYMAALTGKTHGELTNALVGEVFQDPATNSWITRDEYLSGDVVTKLAQAEARAAVDKGFEGHVTALHVVQPKKLEPEQFKAPFGATWVPIDVYQRFVKEEMKTDVDISLTNNEARVEFYVGTAFGRHEFLPEGENLSEWIADALNGRLPEKWSGSGKDRHKDLEKTERYRESLSQLRDAWAQWWVGQAEVAEKLADIYNAMFNREAPREFNGDHLVIPNKSPLIRLRPWQKNVIWRGIQAGNTGIFHAVGSGKTFSMIGIAGELKRLGLARKPIIAVPNPLTKQWADDFIKFYPTARILVPSKEDFEARNRRRFIARIANNDWDAVIIGHSQFERISVRTETLKKFIQEQEDMLLAEAADQMHMAVDDFKTLVDDYEKDDKAAKQRLSGRNVVRSVKDIVKAILRLRARLKKRLDQQKKDAPVVFEEIGVDALLVDEAHYFKNLYFPTSKNNIAGLRGSDSDRAMDMFLKVRLINDASKSRNVFFATGTPITNTMSEVYTMFRYLAQQTLDRLGMGGFDSWAGNYAVASAEMEPTPGGGYKERQRLRSWSNLRELSKLFRRFSDVLTQKDVIASGELKLPKVKGGTSLVISTEPGPGYAAFNESLLARIAALQAGRPDQRTNAKGEMVDDNNLWVNSDASKAAIDLRLVVPGAPADPNGRIPTAAREIAKRYRATEAQKSTQLVFLDMGVPDKKTLDPLPKHVLEGEVDETVLEDDEVADEERGDGELTDEQIDELNAGGRDLYSDLRANLIKQGVKPDEIAFHHQARNPHEEALLFKAVREGRIRVFISTRAKGGVGVNVQNKAVALHHLDVPWRPDQLEQAEGRIIRQGNENEEVEILRYVTKGTFDESRWGLIAIKNDQIVAFQRGELESLEDLDPSQIDINTTAAIASGNPKKLDLLNAERELRGLRARWSNFERRQQSAKREIAFLEGYYAKRLAWLEDARTAAAAAAEWAKAPTIDFTVDLSGARGYSYLTIRPRPQVMDWGTPEGRKAVQQHFVRLLGDHNLDAEQLIAKAGPFDIWASKASVESHHSGQLLQQNGTDISVKLGDRVIGVAPTWWKDDKQPTDYRQSLPAYLSAAKLEKEAETLSESLEQTKKTIATNTEILSKTFGQEAELAAKEKQVTALRVELGLAKQDPADAIVAELGAVADEYHAGTIDAAQWKERNRALWDRAKQANVEKKVTTKLAERDDTADASSPRRTGSSGSTESAEGVFSEDDDVRAGSVPRARTGGALVPVKDGQEIVRVTRAIEFPELVQLARALIDTPSVVRAFRKPGKIAEFRGSGAIRLAAELFKKGNEIQLAKALAHEIGHLKDWLPSYTLKRGNMIGRLFSLDKFLKGTFTDADGETITNAQVRAELKALSDQWRPWDPKKETERFRAYRHSSKELYADAISVLLNNPGMLQAEAPTFYNTFFRELDRKPDAKAAYFALQEFLSGTPEELIQRRRAGVQGMFAEADTKAMDLERQRRAEREAGQKDLWLRTRIQMVDKNTPIIDRVKALEKAGTPVRPDDDPRYYLEERNYIGGLLKAFTERHIQPIYASIQEAGIGWHTFGEALFYERVIAGDRSEMANPRGISPAVAEDLYDNLKASLSADQRADLEIAITKFRRAVRQVSEDAYEAGLYSDELYAQMTENPAYAAYRVVEHIEDQVSWRVYQQKGTLKDIANPADATLLKMLATIRATERQKMLVSTFDFLQRHYPGEIEQAPEEWSGKGRRPVDPPKDPKKAIVYYMDRGRLRGKYVDPYIADALSNKSTGHDHAVVQTLRLVNGRWFRPVFTTMNLGFQTFNVARDFFRFWKNIPTMSIGRALVRYWQAVPLAKVRGFGLSEKPSAAELKAYEDLLDAEEAKILSVTFNDLIRGQEVADTQIADTLTKVGVGTFAAKEQRRHIMRVAGPVLDWITHVGDFIETLPKAAAIAEYQRQGLASGVTREIRSLAPDVRSHIRRKVGSPDFLAGGTYKPVSNELFLFSNAITQAIRSDVEVATSPTTRSGYWWKTASFNILPKILLFGAINGLVALADDDDEGVDDWLLRALRGISEYDLTNYIPIPLGSDSRGNSVYLRFPQDDGGRLVGGLTWKLLQATAGRRDVFEAVSQILDYTAGQFPGLTPSIGVVGDVLQYVSGGRVYDPFRNRFLFTEDEVRAGGWPKLKKFLTYEFQQVGGSVVMRLDVIDRPRDKTPGQQVLDLPIVSNILGRWIRISSYGEVERLRDAQREVQGAEARTRLTERDAVSDAIGDLMGAAPAERTPQALHRKASELVEALYGEATRAEKNRQRGDILRKLRAGMARGQADPLVDAVLSATSNAQKVAIIQRAKATMSADEFAAWMRTATELRVVSPQLRQALGRADAAEATEDDDTLVAVGE